jgi:Glycosyltransferase sugar-binding region containing DXD motif
MNEPVHNKPSPGKTRKKMHVTLLGLSKSLEQSIEKTDGIHFILSEYLKEIELEADDFLNSLTRFNENFEKSLLLELSGTRKTIPAVTHRVWLTDPVQPHMPPEEYIAEILKLANTVTFDHVNYFWTNSSDVAAKMTAYFSDATGTVIVADTSMLKGDPLFPSVEKLIAENKHVLACDLLRILILNKFGGIYADIGVSYQRPLVELAGLSEYLLFLGARGFFQTSLLGCAAGSDIISLMHGYLCNPHVIPLRWVNGCRDIKATSEVAALAGPGFSILFHLFSNPDWRVLVASPNSSLISWSAQKSWYGDKKGFGNANIPQTEPTLLKRADFDAYRKELDEEITYFDCPATWRHRIDILFGLREYFGQNPTRLCKLMQFNGSDKAQGWHNYAPFYNYMIPLMRSKNDALLEVGIGTNYLDVVSNMGAVGVPGASLRGWQEFLSADIYGADVDKRVLFQEDDIKTFFVDQCDRNTIKEMWEAVEAQPSIVIDDGLHTYDANVNFLETTLKHNTQMRVFIVEDVMKRFIPQWLSYFKTADLKAAILPIPHGTNDKDNILIFIFFESGSEEGQAHGN